MRNRTATHRSMSSVAVCAMVAATMTPLAVLAQSASTNTAEHGVPTTTPIKHAIFIIGENRTFDHVFATYVPVNKGESVWNLLSEGIVKADGTPGPNYSSAFQQQAVETGTAQQPGLYQISPTAGKQSYTTLPAPLAGGPKVPFVCPAGTTTTSCVTPANLATAMAVENGLPNDYYQYLLTGGTGLTAGTFDTRISYVEQPVTNLPPGPFQLTPGVPYDAYAQSPVHRFYQMRQQLDCSAGHVTAKNPSGCLSDLFAWVEVTIGAGNNGLPQPAGFNPPYPLPAGFNINSTPTTTGEGSTALGFYNVQEGDAPYLKHLADTYSMSDNYHQAVAGGTGANHIMLGTGDAIWFSDGAGHPQVPPHNQLVTNAGPANAGVVDEIENPNPQPGTNNYYVEDGYGGGSFGSPSYGGGSYSDCSDTTQPGVASVVYYLKSLSRPVNPNCQTGHYYLLNNYNPGYFGDGSNAYSGPAAANASNTVFTVPPSSVRNIGDALLEKNISWAYFGDQFDRYLNDPYDLQPDDAYCNICNWAQYSTSIMTNAQVRTTHLKDTIDLYNDIQNGSLPSVSFVKPSGFVDGHPASSKLDLFEGFVKKIVNLVQANQKLWADTAIFITFDEGGGYWDSGYVQALDYFGDGTRIPMLVVSPYSTGGHISHTYNDHVSFLKFIEKNWQLRPLTQRSRDNLPNPIAGPSNPYVPVNSPAIGDLTDLFNFGRSAAN
jgi:phospholipase C